MKRILFSLSIALLSSFGLRAQVLQVTNLSTCDVFLVGFYGTAPCSTGISSGVNVSYAGAGPIFQTTPTPAQRWLYVDIYDCSTSRRIARIAPPSVSTGCTPSPGPTTASLSFTPGSGSCSCPPRTVFNVVGTDGLNPGDMKLEIY